MLRKGCLLLALSCLVSFGFVLPNFLRCLVLCRLVLRCLVESSVVALCCFSLCYIVLSCVVFCCCHCVVLPCIVFCCCFLLLSCVFLSRLVFVLFHLFLCCLVLSCLVQYCLVLLLASVLSCLLSFLMNGSSSRIHFTALMKSFPVVVALVLGLVSNVSGTVLKLFELWCKYICLFLFTYTYNSSYCDPSCRLFNYTYKLFSL